MQLTRGEDDSLVTSYVFHQQDQSVQQYSGRQKVGKEEEADLGRHDRTCYVMTYKRWMSAGRRPSQSLVTARSDHSLPSVPVGTGGPKSKPKSPITPMMQFIRATVANRRRRETDESWRSYLRRCRMTSAGRLDLVESRPLRTTQCPASCFWPAHTLSVLRWQSRPVRPVTWCARHWSTTSTAGVRENVWGNWTNVKSHVFLDFEKKT